MLPRPFGKTLCLAGRQQAKAPIATSNQVVFSKTSMTRIEPVLHSGEIYLQLPADANIAGILSPFSSTVISGR